MDNWQLSARISITTGILFKSGFIEGAKINANSAEDTQLKMDNISFENPLKKAKNAEININMHETISKRLRFSIEVKDFLPKKLPDFFL